MKGKEILREKGRCRYREERERKERLVRAIPPLLVLLHLLLALFLLQLDKQGEREKKIKKPHPFQ